MPAPSLIHRRESTIVAAFTLVGAVLRFWAPRHLGINHFDEGVYVAFGEWSWQGKGLSYVAPELRFYAPPLYPFLIGLTSILTRAGADIAAILISQVCGVLTIPAVAWLARRSFGPGAGAAAAGLAALSGPHIAYSRMALTDSTLLLAWILALGLGGRFLERPGVLRSIPFGVMVGVAWNIKYNGNLTGVIVALTALLGLIVPGEGGRKPSLKAIGFGLIAAAIMGAMYWPWYRFVESQPEGYAGLMKHHRGYFSGPSAWPEHLRLQLGIAYALSGQLRERISWGAIAWPLAWIGAWLADRVTQPDLGDDRWRGMRFRIGLIGGVVVYGAIPSFSFFVGLARLPRLLADRRSGPRMIGIFWLLMAALTPFYHPYGRLWLPLHAAGWLIVADLIVRLGPSPEFLERTKALRRISMSFVAIALLLGCAYDLATYPGPRFLGSPIEPTDDVWNLAAKIVANLDGMNPRPTRVHVLARPSLLYYLTRDAAVPISREAYWDAMEKAAEPGKWAVVDGVLVEAPSPRPESFDRFILRFNIHRRSRELYTILPATTALDVDPGLAIPLDAHPNFGRTITIMPLEP